MNEELKIIITAEIDKLKNELKNGKKEVKNFSTESKTSFKDFNDEIQKAGEFSKTALATVATAIAGIATATLALSASTQEYRNNQAKLITAFESAGSSANVAKEVYNDLFRVLGDDDTAVEASNHLAQMTTNQQHLAEWTDICQGVYATFGDSIPIEGLTEASNETAKVGQVTGTLADALNWAGINEDEFNEKLQACNSEAEREALIRTTLNGIYSEASAKFEENNQAVLKQNEAQAKLNEKLAVLGEKMAPVNTALTEFATTILDKLMPYITDFVDNHLDQFIAILEDVATAVGQIILFIAENWETISTIAIVIGAITTALTILSTVMGIVNAVMLASPITWIIAGIVALIAVIALCVIHWEDIKEAGKKAWEGIKKAWEAVGKWFGERWEDIKGAFANVGKWFSEKFEGAKQGIKTAWNNVGEWFGEKKEQIQNNFAKTKQFFKTTFSGAWSAVKSAWSNPQQFFADAKNKIQGAFSTVDTWLGNKFGDGWQKVKNVFSGVGAFFRNIWNTITGIFKNIGQKIVDSMSESTKTAINAVLGTATKIINGFISAINFAIGFINKIPGVNISKLEPLTAPRLAKGGVVDSATLAMIGENGKEAVVPLENNLEWLDKLAGMLNDRMGINGPIVMNVDGKTFAQVSCDSINALTKHRGSIPLVLA